MRQALGLHAPGALQQISIGGNCMTSTGLKEFDTWLNGCTALKVLDLSCTPRARAHSRPHAARSCPPSDTALYDLLLQDQHISKRAQDGAPGSRPSQAAAPSTNTNLLRSSFESGSTVSRGRARPPEGKEQLHWGSADVWALCGTLTRVREAWLDGCVLDAAAGNALVTILAGNTSLQALVMRQSGDAVLLQGNRDRSALTLGQMLGKLAQRDDASRLNEISLIGYEAVGMENLAVQALGQHPFRSLRSLHLDSRAAQQTPERGGALATSAAMDAFEHAWALLPGIHALTALSLHSARPYKLSTKLFVTATGALTSLKRLELTNALIGNTGLLLKIVARAGHTLSGLHTLRLHHIELSAPALAHLGKLLTHMPHVLELALVNANISGDGLSHVLSRARRDTAPWLATLKHLDLSLNRFGVVGARAIAKCLGDMGRLEVLRISGAHIHSQGADDLAGALLTAYSPREAPAATGHCALQELHLEDNGVGRRGTEALAAAFAATPRLRVLRYTGNKPGSEGCQRLMHALLNLTGLQVVSLGTVPCADAPAARASLIDAHTEPPGNDKRAQAQAIRVARVVATRVRGHAIATVVSSREAGALTWDGVHCVAVSVRHMHALRELTLVGVGAAPVTWDLQVDTWLDVLARSVSLLPGLKVLDLRGAGMLPAGAAALVRAARGMAELEVLDVRGAVTTQASQGLLDRTVQHLACTVLVDPVV